MKAMYYPLSHPPVDDDYLVYEDMEKHHHSAYDYSADWDEDEAVERDLGDPCRLAKKCSYEMAVS